MVVMWVSAKSLQSCPTLCDPTGHRALLQGNLPDPGMKPMSLMTPALACGFFTTSTTWEAWVVTWDYYINLTGNYFTTYFESPYCTSYTSIFICQFCLNKPENKYFSPYKFFFSLIQILVPIHCFLEASPDFPTRKFSDYLELPWYLLQLTQ